MTITRREFVAGVSALSFTASMGTAAADDAAFKPEGTVTFVVDTGAGGGGDLFGRAVAQGIGTATGAKIAVENRVGGGGVVGDSYVLAHKGQGNVLSVNNSALILVPYAINPPPPYTWKTFTPIVELAEDQQLLIVPANSPYKTFPDLIAGAQAKPKYIRAAGSSGAGTALAVTRLMEKAKGVTFQEVVLRSGSESVARMLSNDVDFALLNPSEALGQLQAGTLRALAVFADKRYGPGSGLEQIPTAQEQGVDITFSQWRGLLGPEGMTDAQVKFWVDGAKAWTQTPDYASYISKNQLFPAFRSGADFVSLIQKQDDQLASVFGKGQ
jgi:putative tricarboxylic transport membrane protein